MALSVRATGLSDNLEDGTLASDVPETRETQIAPEDAWWMQTARQCIADSETYLDVAKREQIDRNLANFRSAHPKGSKYHRPEYAGRSQLFLPKTRAVALRTEAASAAAFFTTEDVTHIKAANEANVEQAAGADLWHGILEHRLRHDIKWFQTVIGAVQDAFVQGICIACQSWDYRVDGDGDVTHDKPAVRLVPIERFRFSPAADWRDVVGDSEYIVEDMPMTVAKVKDKMRANEWAYAADSVIAASRKSKSEKKLDRDGQANKEEADTVLAHMIASVHKIILRHEGIDYIWYMLGTEHMLTRPTRLKDVHPLGSRLYVVGAMTIEAHSPVPQAMAELLQSLQAEANHIKNERRDNVALVLSPRMLLDTSASIDARTLSLAVPGGVITGTNVQNAVEPLVTPDVTASAYAEEDRNNAAIDEMAGSFNPSSVNTNRNMGDTATGMELLAADSNVMTEYHLEIFATTFVEPVLQQVLLLEQHYEDDFSIFAEAAQAKDIAGKYQTDALTEGMLQASVKLTVKVGVDATNPERKAAKLNNLMVMGTNLGIAMDGPALFAEAAGTLGFASGQQFVIAPEEQQEQPPDPAVQLEQAKLEADSAKAQTAMQKVQQDGQIAMQRLQLDAQRMQQTASQAQMTHELNVKRAELDLQRAQLQMQMHQMGIQSSEEIALMQDGTTREIAMLDADTAKQKAILDGEITMAVAKQRDDTDRAKAAESANVAREGFFAKQQSQQGQQANA